MSTTVPWPSASTQIQVKAEGPATLKNRPNTTTGPGGKVPHSNEHMTLRPKDQFQGNFIVTIIKCRSKTD
jgi:hypothetical protein